MIAALLLALSCLTTASAAEPPPPGEATEHEAIKYFERHRPSYFLLGTAPTKVQISFKVSLIRRVPFYFGYTQLMMWDLFRDSAPFRDLDFNPELFYRFSLGDADYGRDLDVGADHESNGRAGPDSRSWNHVFVKYTSTRMLPTRGLWWSAKLSLPYGAKDDPSKRLPRRRGVWEFQLGVDDLFGRLFEVNELIFRVYGGGGTRVNPLQGGQELTYREKGSRRAFLLPLYFQIFHGYGEDLLEADEKRWGFRAGIGF